MKSRFAVACLMTVVLVLFAACPFFKPPMDEEEAKEVFLEWLETNGVPDFPETPMVGLSLGEVPAGGVVGSYSPLDGGGQASSETSRGSRAIAEKGWLFYLDEQPGGFYEHPGRMVVVSTKGKILHSENITGWPIINGIRPSALASPTSSDFLHAIVYNPWGWILPSAGIKDWVVGARFLRIKGAVVVNGLWTSENLYSEATSMHAQVLTDMQDLFTAANVRSVASSSVVANPAQRIRDAVEYLVAERDCTNITLYMIAHGGTDSIAVGGYSYTVANLRTLISAYPGVRFSVLLETCHGGSWLNNFDGSLAGSGYPKLDNLGIFITSTSADKGAYPDWDSAVTGSGSTIYDFDPSDAYVEWTSDFLKRLATWTSDANYPTVQNFAKDYSIETEWALYYFCYWKVKGSPSVPPAAGFSSPPSTYTMTERLGVAVQQPQIYHKWFVVL